MFSLRLQPHWDFANSNVGRALELLHNGFTPWAYDVTAPMWISNRLDGSGGVL